MKVKRNQVTGLALIIIGLVFGYLTMQFDKPMTAAYPGPKLFPLIAVFGFIVCGLGIFIEGTFGKKEEKPFLSKTGWGKVVSMFLILVVYVFLMKYLGYLIVTPFALFATSTLIARGQDQHPRLRSRIIYSVAVTLLIYAMYVIAFGMTLPSGLLFD